jgi:hypothetical protein
MKKRFLILLLSCTMLLPIPSARADIWGGDVAVLIQILANALQQLAQLRQLLSTGSDTLGLLRDINSGIRDGLAIIQIINPKFNPGLYGNTRDAAKVLQILTDLYGRVPQTTEANLQTAQDQSVAESLAMHGTLYEYADQVDAESQRMLAHAQVVSPQGAGKLQAQSLAVLIGVTTQMLRTNSAMLKIMAQNMALENRQGKIRSEQFKAKYEDMSNALRDLPRTQSLSEVGL